VEPNVHIVIDSLYKTFGATTALENINLQFEGGEFVTVLGSSGCGKTTLLHLLAGLTTPSKGSILIDGEQKDTPGADRVVVFQQAGLYPGSMWRTTSNSGCRCRESTSAAPAGQRRHPAHDRVGRLCLAQTL
jgi:ABC-type nitrate/sulfonate/bicarbonate transport system, ATPase component